MTPSEHKGLSALAHVWLDSLDASHRGCGDNLQSWLDNHEAVPAVTVRTLEILLGGDDVLKGEEYKDFMSLRTALWDLVQLHNPSLPPNPHQQSTYLWAREEHQRGRVVGRDVWRERSAPARQISQDTLWEHCGFTHADFTATDWEVVE